MALEKVCIVSRKALVTASIVSRKTLFAAESTEKTLMSHAVLLSQLCLWLCDFYWGMDWLSTLRFFDIATRWEREGGRHRQLALCRSRNAGGCFAVSLAAGESTGKLGARMRPVGG
jgi:hypothetical protein